MFPHNLYLRLRPYASAKQRHACLPCTSSFPVHLTTSSLHESRSRHLQTLSHAVHPSVAQKDDGQFLFWRCGQMLAMASSLMRFLDLTQRRITVGRTPLCEWPPRRRDHWQHTAFTRDIHASGGIRTHNLSWRAAADIRLRPRGHWDRRL